MITEEDINKEDSLKIVPISPEAKEELEIKKNKSSNDRACPSRHRSIEVDEKTRTIQCSDCGFTVDPFDYILSWAQEGERRMEGLKGVEIQRRINQLEHDDLKRKIKNMRATLKRGGSPQSEKEKHEYNIMRWNPKNLKK